MARLLSIYVIEDEKDKAHFVDEKFKADLLIADPERYFNVYEKPGPINYEYDEGYQVPQDEADLKKVRREMWREGLLSPEDIELIEAEKESRA